MKKSELRAIIKEELLKEMSAARTYILVTKSKNSNATTEDFKKIITKIQQELNKIPGVFKKYHTQYPTSSDKYEVELILNSDKITNELSNNIKKIKSSSFNIDSIGF